MRAFELFAGAGGMALGVARAGFEHAALIESDPTACKTLRLNSGLLPAQLFERDVREMDYRPFANTIDLLCAGAPCQPFSVGGKSRAHRDKRDMFSEVVRAANALKPQAILIENVKGLLRSRFANYFEYLRSSLEIPSFERHKDETWTEHYRCLKNHRLGFDGLRYDVHVLSLNAADFGVPQWRERVFIVAFRSDLKVAWNPPTPTHSLDSLVWSQAISGKYWRDRGLFRTRPGIVTKRYAERLRVLRALDRLPGTLVPWRTVRDAIEGLPKLRQGQNSDAVDNHFLNRGARAYAQHTGSRLDEPSKTLKAGSHGVPGGENSLSLGGDKLRYFSVRECARLQTFPDAYRFAGTWTQAMRQVGNAVPVVLAQVMAERIRALLEVAKTVRVVGNVLSFTAPRLRRAG